MTLVERFEHVLEKEQCERVGLAVSGGVDSVALLFFAREIASRCGMKFSVITVDHRLREKSRDDAKFVGLLATDCGFPCEIATLKDGAVFDAAAKRGRGIEEAARFCRYEAFRDFAAQNSLDLVCTAHTKDDLLETLLMQFLCGKRLSGIKRRNGIFFRPMLDFERGELEAFLTRLGVPHSEDESNAENRFFRNRVRHFVVPLLDMHFEGWRNGVLTTFDRMQEMHDFVDSAANAFDVRGLCDGIFGLRRRDFDSAPEALKRAVLLRAFSLLGVDVRISNAAIEKISCSNRVIFADFSVVKNQDFIFFVRNDATFAERELVEGTEFSVGGVVFSSQEGDFVEFADGKCRIPRSILPCVVRPLRKSDFVETAAGAMKSVWKILADWKIPPELRLVLPAVEKNGKILAFFASHFGSKNWIVRPQSK